MAEREGSRGGEGRIVRGDRQRDEEEETKWVARLLKEKGEGKLGRKEDVRASQVETMKS